MGLYGGISKKKKQAVIPAPHGATLPNAARNFADSVRLT
jgi:hypothetical protein